MQVAARKMTVDEFGQQLISSRDLDPVYCVVWGCVNGEWGPLTTAQWLLAYWCFYHVGTASWICDEPPDYWDRMIQAATTQMPRSSERRHFRGMNAVQSVNYLRERGIDSLFKPLVGPHSMDAAEVMRIVQGWTGFGPWIAFKVADMLERLALRPVTFDDSAILLFDSPREGALIVHENCPMPPSPTHDPVRCGLEGTVVRFRNYKAPPRYERGCSYQEAETVLCKYKSYLNGRYHIGEDIEATRRGLRRFPFCRLSKQLYAAGQTIKLWS